ncbi:MAG: HAD family hydrolase [Geminocystis sp.]|nr:HAD family hydrolase [Geminocystis sp.]HIK38909.1 HAD family hydrolase [Geminocystis sp. M7585_C2015_104]MCS7148367.1 HAD family hydrolase [Geminocystis sp.]MCX8078319.1 HAD family hydrolase [Geminocystis sp.]MDW8116045.1 HAD family hydrolase [Geminocystis sp.]
MSLRALIFDVDGTLAETEKDGHRVAFNLAFAKKGLPWHWDVDLYGSLVEIGGGKERIKHYISHYQPSFAPDQPLEEFIKELHSLKNRYYRQILENHSLPLRIGVKRLIREAKDEGIKLAVASTASEDNVKALLETLFPEEKGWFEVIAAGDMVANKKPSPDIYLLALEKLNLSPRECLAIEDTQQGLKAAVAAGLKTVVTVSQYSQGQDFQEAILVLNHLGEPDFPFQVIKGNPHGYQFFSISLARKIIEHPFVAYKI